MHNEINHGFRLGSGVGLRFGGRVLDDGESETVSKADKMAESRGFRGAVIMPNGGGRETGIGEGIAGVVALGIGGVARLRWASGGKDVVSPYSYAGDMVGRSR